MHTSVAVETDGNSAQVSAAADEGVNTVSQQHSTTTNSPPKGGERGPRSKGNHHP